MNSKQNSESESQHSDEEPRPLSEDFHELLDDLHGDKMTIDSIEKALEKRDFALLVMLLTVPFVIAPIPGILLPFGATILFMGIRIILGKKPQLPQWVLKKKIKTSILKKTLKMFIKIVVILEKFAKQRLLFLACWPSMKKLIGVGIASDALFLTLPLPIPFANTLPAISILLLSAGLMEEDGLLVLLGYFTSLLAWVYLLLIILLGKTIIEHIWSHF